MSPRKLAAVASLTALAALMAPGAALADDSTTFVSALKSPAVVDGKRYSAKQVQKRFADTQLFFVLGSREEADGAVAAFTTREGRSDYLRETKRDGKRNAKAKASWNPGQSVFYSDWFLEGGAIAVNNNSAIGDLSQHCLSGWPFGCFVSWDNQISSAKTGASRATLYDRPFLSTQGSSVTIPSMDSVEVWRFFDNVTSSIWVNP